jgi:hypothetical protein
VPPRFVLKGLLKVANCRCGGAEVVVVVCWDCGGDVLGKPGCAVFCRIHWLVCSSYTAAPSSSGTCWSSPGSVYGNPSSVSP